MMMAIVTTTVTATVTATMIAISYLISVSRPRELLDVSKCIITCDSSVYKASQSDQEPTLSFFLSLEYLVTVTDGSWPTRRSYVGGRS